MCTVIVSIDPGSLVPVLLIGVRDEFETRPWSPPAAHWNRWPGLVGGLDLRAGGTWLAVDPALPRMSCLLNGFGRHVEDETRRSSRGELPLRAAAGLSLDDVELTRFDPFHIVVAEPDRVVLTAWNGVLVVEQVLEAGLHMIVNSGLEGQGREDPPHPDAPAEMAARIATFRPLLAAASRPEPISGTTAEAWQSWLEIVEGHGLDRAAPNALIVRRDFGERGWWGSSSISLVGLRRGGVRYDFRPVTGGTWTRVK